MTEGPERRFPSFDGREIAYLDTGDPAGALVALFHGFASHVQQCWVDSGVVAALVAAGRRVVAADARGHGRSDRPHDAEAYADDAMARDARALLDHLGVTAPRSVDVVGYSMGSVMATRWVPGDGRVRAVVLGGIGDHVADGSRDAIRGKLAKYLARPDAAMIRNPFIREMRLGWEAVGNDSLALAACDAAGMDDPTPGMLAGMGVPALVLTGESDSLVGSPADLAARIPGATSRTVPGEHPDAMRSPEFAAAVVEFLTRQPLPSPDEVATP